MFKFFVLINSYCSAPTWSLVNVFGIIVLLWSWRWVGMNGSNENLFWKLVVNNPKHVHACVVVFSCVRVRHEHVPHSKSQVLRMYTGMCRLVWCQDHTHMQYAQGAHAYARHTLVHSYTGLFRGTSTLVCACTKVWALTTDAHAHLGVERMFLTSSRESLGGIWMIKGTKIDEIHMYYNEQMQDNKRPHTFLWKKGIYQAFVWNYRTHRGST